MPMNPRTPWNLDLVVADAVKYLTHPSHGQSTGNREAAYRLLTHGAALRGCTVTGVELLDAIDAIIAAAGPRPFPGATAWKAAIVEAAIAAVVAAQPAGAKLTRAAQ